MASGHPTFCSFLWTDALVDLDQCRVHYCCKTPSIGVSEEELDQQGLEVFKNKKSIVESRQQMLSNEKPHSCDYCWKMEKNKLPHPRQKSTRYDGFFSDFEGPKYFSQSLNTLEIVMSKQCQMSCSYCSPRFSSKWEEAVSSNKIDIPESGRGHMSLIDNPTPEFREKFKKLFLDYLPEALSSVEDINIIGGEPLLQKSLFEILEKIESFKGEQDITIRVVSNLSIPTSTFQNFLDYVQNNKSRMKFTLSPSLENIGAQAEFTRTGLNWETFNSNLQAAFNLGLFEKIEFIHSANCLSVVSLKNFTEYFKDLIREYPEQNIELINNPISNPSYLNPMILDQSFVPYLDQGIEALSSPLARNHQGLKQVKNYAEGLRTHLLDKIPENSDQTHRKEFVHWINQVEKTFRKNFLDTFPEFKHWIL